MNTTMSVCLIYCSIGMQTSQLNDLLWFFNVGLGGKVGKLKGRWPVKTLEILLKENEHVDVRLIVLLLNQLC